ncbi:MAG: DNA repair protein RadC [Bacillota bacterium]|jgi:DNA repair protein RadC|nr:DNA repair protein RadC [Bacillota bacterium]HOA78559.1 DNA repair protein RadC [Bacilli bacterium]HPZ27318.1 DNA repair protein RadC [Bacilli bacterium]HQC89952.1 DNA repair protein RadC [Bacilli bacterium]
MSFLLREMPESERPRERLLKNGVKSLSNYELLAIILRTGSRSVSAIDLAKELLARYPAIDRLNEATVEELQEIKGVGRAKAVALLAAIELGKRINIPCVAKVKVQTPYQSYLYLRDSLQHLNQEHLVAVYLNSQSEIIAERTISIGTLTHTLFNCRDILKWGLKLSAKGIIIAHNHPSGNPEPSGEDYEITVRLVKAAAIVEILIVDHIIIGKNRYYSFMEHKKI